MEQEYYLSDDDSDDDGKSHRDEWNKFKKPGIGFKYKMYKKYPGLRTRVNILKQAIRDTNVGIPYRNLIIEAACPKVLIMDDIDSALDTMRSVDTVYKILGKYVICRKENERQAFMDLHYENTEDSMSEVIRDDQFVNYAFACTVETFFKHIEAIVKLLECSHTDAVLTETPAAKVRLSDSKLLDIKEEDQFKVVYFRKIHILSSLCNDLTSRLGEETGTSLLTFPLRVSSSKRQYMVTPPGSIPRRYCYKELIESSTPLKITAQRSTIAYVGEGTVFITLSNLNGQLRYMICSADAGSEIDAKVNNPICTYRTLCPQRMTRYIQREMKRIYSDDPTISMQERSKQIKEKFDLICKESNQRDMVNIPEILYLIVTKDTKESCCAAEVIRQDDEKSVLQQGVYIHRKVYVRSIETVYIALLREFRYRYAGGSRTATKFIANINEIGLSFDRIVKLDLVTGV
jgi:hypothetical protein